LDIHFLRVQALILSTFHPVTALLDFALGLTLARQVSTLASTQSGFEKSTSARVEALQFD